MDIFSLMYFNEENNVVSLKNNLLQTNKQSIKYALFLSDKDAEIIAQANRENLKSQNRVEFGESAVIKIIEKFMQSSYISQDNYADTILTLTEIFYEAKEESLDILSDDEIIDIMFEFFENESGGSADVLQNRDMEYFCRKIRYKALNITE